MAFVLVKKNFVEPFKVQYVAQNEKAGKELLAEFSIKHFQDWAETAVEEFTLIAARFKKIDSLLKTQKKKLDAKQAADSFRINAHLNRLIAENGLVEPEALVVWGDMSAPDKAQVTKAFLEWCKEESEKKVAEK